MSNMRDIFHKISYLQYLLMLVGGYFYILFIISLINRNIDWSQLNNVLIFFGISVSLSTLQDTTKTQNKMSKRIWQNPKKGKWALITIGVLVVILITIGIIGVFRSKESIHKEISFGLIVLGIGYIGILKAAMEMFENHRLDKNPSSD
jgi:uncharacterized membrane protein